MPEVVGPQRLLGKREMQLAALDPRALYSLLRIAHFRKVFPRQPVEETLELVRPQLGQAHPLAADQPVPQPDGAVGEEGHLAPGGLGPAVETDDLDGAVVGPG